MSVIVPVNSSVNVVSLQFENRSIDFFPRKCALDLIDREIEATTDDLLKQVKTATHAVKTTTHDLAQDITDQAQGASEVVVTRLSKKISRGFEDISEKGGLEAKLQKMNDEIESLKSGIKEQLAQVHGVQQDLSNQIAALRTSILERLPLKVRNNEVYSLVYGCPIVLCCIVWHYT